MTIALGISLIVGGAHTAKAQSMAVIVNNDNPIGSMKQIEVKLYYLRKIKQIWPGTDSSIQPVQMSTNSDAKSTFLSAILKMSEEEVAAYFKQRQFANAEQMPPSFSNDAQVIKYVSENKGAIGYVSQSALSSAGGAVKSVLAQ